MYAQMTYAAYATSSGWFPHVIRGKSLPGDSKWPFDPLVGGHDPPLKGSRFHHPKKVTAWITRYTLVSSLKFLRWFLSGISEMIFPYFFWKNLSTRLCSPNTLSCREKFILCITNHGTDLCALTLFLWGSCGEVVAALFRAPIARKRAQILW